jgi:type IV pilus assembly protein PilB
MNFSFQGNSLKKNKKKADGSAEKSGEETFNQKSLGMKNSAVASIKVAPKEIKEDVIGLIPEEVAKRYRLAAFEKTGKTIKVAMANPQDISALNALRFISEKEKLEIEAYEAPEDVLEKILGFYAGPTAAIKSAIESIKDDSLSSPETEEEVSKRSGAYRDAPVAKLVQVIITHAIDGKASDIHIEPMERDFRVRYRLDGVLHISLILPKEIGPAIISRIKILANLKIDEKRKPQDGRFRLKFKDKNIDFRVSSLPVMEGEKIVMRILDKDEGVTSVEKLGMIGTALEHAKMAINETYGMILMTGPTGSGKSTTLYALLKVLNKEDQNIITLEDPIEYYIEGLNQSQVKPEIGYTFASGLRSILRQDPNIIMVGEIRDAETAELAVHAALTGHLMFSTLHTNTAIGAIPRMIDMGIEPFLLSSSLRLVMAQRLVRMICEDCKEEEKVPDVLKQRIMEEIKKISAPEMEKCGIKIDKEITLYHGKGCDKCSGTGLRGRLAVFEVVPVTSKIRDIIIENKGSEELITRERDAMNILTMKQDGLLKVLKGLTTLEEVERVTEGNIALAEEND